MSRGQLARTRENFPRMNTRAERRRARRKAQAQYRALVALTKPEFWASVDATLQAFADVFSKTVVPAVNRFCDQLRMAWANVLVPRECDDCGAVPCDCPTKPIRTVYLPGDEPAADPSPPPGPILTAPMLVETAEQQRQDEIYSRHIDLAYQRGHLRRLDRG